MKRQLTALFLSISMLLLLLTGCAGSSAKLGPKNPVTLTMWHVFGSQTESPMNDMVEEFNHTAGKEKGITINITSVSNSSDIQFVSSNRGQFIYFSNSKNIPVF